MPKFKNRTTGEMEEIIQGNFVRPTDEQMELIYAKMEYDRFHGLLRSDGLPKPKNILNELFYEILYSLYFAVSTWIFWSFFSLFFRKQKSIK